MRANSPPALGEAPSDLEEELRALGEAPPDLEDHRPRSTVHHPRSTVHHPRSLLPFGSDSTTPCSFVRASAVAVSRVSGRNDLQQRFDEILGG